MTVGYGGGCSVTGSERGDERHEDDRSVPGPDQRAENFRQSRRARKTEIAEDYVELIADLIDGGGEARAVDIARGLGVSHATVV